MSILTKFLARLRQSEAERRVAPRYATHLENRLSVRIELADAVQAQPSGARALSLVGYTRNVSETGLGVVLQSVRIAGRGIVGSDRSLRVLLGLPGGNVEMTARAVHQVSLEGGDTGHLVGIQIQEMSAGDRARYLKFLRSLAVPDI